MKTGRRVLFYLAILGSLFLAAVDAMATELGDLCWLTDKNSLIRFSITQSGVNHYTYTGLFDDGDGVLYTVIGEVGLVNGILKGTFNGSKTTSSYFRTGTWEVDFTPALAATVTGIRETYFLPNGTPNINGGVYVDYHVMTATLTTCP
jgi:hypothetical protein